MKTWRLSTMGRWLLRHWLLGVPLMVVGALLGAALVRWAFPTPYWADSTLYVGFNADAVLRYPEDYKNWELTQLDGFVTSQAVLQPVLEALAASGDAYWQGWTLDDLAAHLQPRWFTAGEWHLHATADTPRHATFLAAVWGKVALDKIHAAIQEGERFLAADRRWRMLETRREAAEAARARLQAARKALEGWLDRLGAGNVAVTAADRAEMAYWASFAEFPEGGQVQPLPSEGATVAGYRAWGEAVLRQMAAADQAWQAELDEIAAAQQKAAATREQARRLSAGISAEWQVALAADMPGNAALEAEEPGFWANLAASATGLKPQAHAVYTWKDGAAVGALAGLLLWMAWALLAALWQGERAFGEGEGDA